MQPGCASDDGAVNVEPGVPPRRKRRKPSVRRRKPDGRRWIVRKAKAIAEVYRERLGDVANDR
jgi:hypothetical protein